MLNRGAFGTPLFERMKIPLESVVAETGSQPVYRRPPIIERVITAYARMPREQFAERIDGWKSVAVQGFPYSNPKVEWDLNIEEKEGVPMLADGGPTMRIHHWFFEHPQKENRGFAHHTDSTGLEAKMSVNLLRDGDKVFRFKDVEGKFREWLPNWAGHFGVKSFMGIAVDYVNLLNRETVPEFYQQGRLHVGRVFRLFTDIPGPHITLVPPYDCQVNLLLDEKMPANGRIQLRSGMAEGLRIDMQMRSLTKKEKEISMDEAFTEVLALHKWMVTYFEALFTEEAKATFQPVQ